MKPQNSIKILAFLIIILVITQSLTIYFILLKSENTLNAVNSLGKRINDNISTINFENKDIQSKINSLAEAVNSITLTQTSLKNQINQIKATTSSDFSGIIEESIKGVVTVKTDIGQGTGFILTKDGYFITNAHVLSGAHYAEAHSYDNLKYEAELIGYNPTIDLALLKINDTFSNLSLGNSDNVKAGEKVIAIGNPLGLSFTATEGIISARDRIGSNNLPYYFQTDVSLNPGNSGGPLINKNGEVIGINNFKIAGSENIGFALESNYIKQTINQIAMKAFNQTIV